MIKRFLETLANSKAERELNSLSNRQLADIGITRSEIRSVVRARPNDIF